MGELTIRSWELEGQGFRSSFAKTSHEFGLLQSLLLRYVNHSVQLMKIIKVES